MTRDERSRKGLHRRNVREPGSDHGRNEHDAACKDHGDHASGIHLERQIAGLAAHDLGTYSPARTLEWNATVRLLDEYDKADNQDHDSENKDLDGERLDIFLKHFNFCKGSPRKAADDTGEDDKRNTVTHTVRGNLLAQVHHEDRTGGEGQGS